MELRLDGWSIGARFSVCHLIPLHERCGRLHGHTYAVSCVFHGELAHDGDMIMDFISVKRALRELCEELDHHVLVPTRNPHASVTEVEGNVVVETHGKRYSFPAEDVRLLPIRSTTAERLAGWFLERFLEGMEVPPDVTRVELGVREGKGQGAWASKDVA